MKLTAEDFDEIEYKLVNSLRITLDTDGYEQQHKVEVNTKLNGKNWIDVTVYILAYRNWLLSSSP